MKRTTKRTMNDFNIISRSKIASAPRPVRAEQKEMRVFRVSAGDSDSALRFVELPPNAHKLPCPVDTRSDNDEASKRLNAQIRQGYQEYLSGQVRPIDDFMAELEIELANENKDC